MKLLQLCIFFLIMFSFLAFAYPSIYPTGVTIYNQEKTSNGYTLFAPLGSHEDVTGTTFYLIDMNGVVMHKWQTEYPAGLAGYLTADGNLIYAGKTKEGFSPTPGKGGIIQELDPYGNIIWEYQNDQMHHDFFKMENGNIIALVWEELPRDLNRKVKGGISGTEINGTIWSEKIIEVNNNGEIVWEWYAHEHLDFDFHRVSPLESRKEWLHSNSIKHYPAGNAYSEDEILLVSFRQTDSIVLINKNSKEVLWGWGPGQIKYQHDATLLDNGNILLFDNGMHRSATMGIPLPHSRVIEVDPNIDEIVWEYLGTNQRHDDFFSAILSGAQKLDNGNTLITEGITGRIFEVTLDGEIVWEYISPFSVHPSLDTPLFKAQRYTPDEVNHLISWSERIKSSLYFNRERALAYTGWFFTLLFFILFICFRTKDRK